MAENKEKKDLASVITSIQKKLGKNTIKFGSKEEKVDVIPFSIPSMNKITGIGGIPKGRLVEFHGMDGTFKSTFALDIIKNAQAKGLVCVYVDAEYTFSAEYAEKVGVDVESLVIIQPNSAEEAFDLMEQLIDSGEIGVIVLDSLAALSPQTELENEFGKANIGVMARLVGQALRKLTGKIGKTNTALVFLNQLREQLGGYVVMKTTPGGNAVKFYASMRFECSKLQMKEGNEVIGANIKVKVVKNKLAIPFKTTELEVVYGEGFNIDADLIEQLIEENIIEKAGAGWITIEGQKFQGIDKVVNFLNDNLELKEKLISDYYNKIK